MFIFTKSNISINIQETSNDDNNITISLSLRKTRKLSCSSRSEREKNFFTCIFPSSHSQLARHLFIFRVRRYSSNDKDTNLAVYNPFLLRKCFFHSLTIYFIIESKSWARSFSRNCSFEMFYRLYNLISMWNWRGSIWKINS